MCCLPINRANSHNSERLTKRQRSEEPRHSQVPDLTTEIELELAGGPEATLTGFGHLLECGGRPQGPAEDRLCRLQLGLAGQTGLIQDRLGGIQRLVIE